MRAHIPLLFVAALAAGCVTRIGKGPEAFPVANSPAGVATTVVLRRGGTVTGELLEVRDTALVLRVDNKVALIPNTSIANAGFQGGDFRGNDLRIHYVTPAEFRNSNLRLLSRYPSGISPSVMAALLSASGMSEPTVLR